MGEEEDKDAQAGEVPVLRPVVDLDYRHQEICQECGVYPADHKGYCEGCLAYREHQE